MTGIQHFLSTRFLGFCLKEMEGLHFDTKKPSGKNDVHVRVDEATRYQDILGMGYSFEHTSCYNVMQLPEDTRRSVMELLVDPARGAGMNLWRLCIGSPDFTYDFYSYDDIPAGQVDPGLGHFSIENDRQYVIPVVKLAQEINPDILFVASPWSPPGWMKIPEPKMRKGRVEVEGGKGLCSGRIDPKYYGVYADYLVKYLQAYRDEGIPIHAITVQNEPHHNWYLMPTCWWDAENERDFIKNYLGPKLHKSGLTTEIWCWDHNWGMFKPASYPVKVLSDPGAAKHVSGIAFHHYDNIGVQNMGKFHALFPGKAIHFTEGSLFWLWGAARLIEYFKQWSVSYNGWVPFIATDGSPNLGPFKNAKTILERIVTGKALDVKEVIPEEFAFPLPGMLARFDYYILVHFTRFIQRGAFRIKSTGKTPVLISEISFFNPDGTIVSIIVNRRHRSIATKLSWNGQFAMINLPRQSISTLRWTTPDISFKK